MIKREKIEEENIIDFDIFIREEKIKILLLIEKTQVNETKYMIRFLDYKTKNKISEKTTLEKLDEIFLLKKPLFIQFIKKKITKEDYLFTIIDEDKFLKIYKIFEKKKIVILKRKISGLLI